MVFLVIGGTGFLGSHIVDQLSKQGETVIVLDLNPPSDKERKPEVNYFTADILDEGRLEDILRQTNPDVVLHTASPVHGLPDRIYFQVNDLGTRVVISSCKKASVSRLVYTSSTGVVWTGVDFNRVTEEDTAYPIRGYDAYHHAKAIGERAVLSANGKDGFRTLAIRPCGMTGERDKQLFWRMAEVLEKGQHNIQIGDNANLVDYLYVGNAAHAHIQAARKLISDPETVAGEVFFITNNEPMPQWDFARLIWKELGDDGKVKIVKIPRTVGMIMAILAEFWTRITRGSTQFARFAVRFLTATQTYNIEKVGQKLLGYSPEISLEEGIKRTAVWWKETGAREHAEQARAKKEN